MWIKRIFITCIAFVAVGCAQMPNTREAFNSKPNAPVHLFVDDVQFKYEVPTNLTYIANPIPIFTIISAMTEIAHDNMSKEVHAKLNQARNSQGIQGNFNSMLVKSIVKKLEISGRTVVVHPTPFVDRVIGGSATRAGFVPKPNVAAPLDSIAIAVRSEFGSCSYKVITPCSRVSVFSLAPIESAPPDQPVAPWLVRTYPTDTAAATRYPSLDEAVKKITDFDRNLQSLIDVAATDIVATLSNPAGTK